MTYRKITAAAAAIEGESRHDTHIHAYIHTYSNIGQGVVTPAHTHILAAHTHILAATTQQQQVLFLHLHSIRVPVCKMQCICKM